MPTLLLISPFFPQAMFIPRSRYVPCVILLYNSLRPRHFSVVAVPPRRVNVAPADNFRQTLRPTAGALPLAKNPAYAPARTAATDWPRPPRVSCAAVHRLDHRGKLLFGI